MIWLYAVTSPSGNRLALLISALRVIGILGFALLAGFFIIQDAYLETTLSILTALAWIAATTEAMDLVLDNSRVIDSNPLQPRASPQARPGS